MSLYEIETNGRLEPYLSQEYLLTNGLGGFASSTIPGCNTRRYHGILCAATMPPVGRVMTVNRIGEILCLDGEELDKPPANLLEFSVNQFGDRFHPHGEQYLRRFELEDTARWEYEIEGVKVIKELQLVWMKNVAAVRYTVKPDRERRVQLNLLPFISLRDFHALRRVTGARFDVRPGERQVCVSDDGRTVNLWSDAGRFVQKADWWYGQKYAIETERGQDDSEDLFQPGRFVLETAGPASITIWVSIDTPQEHDWNTELKRRREVVAAACTLPENVQPAGGPSIVCTTDSIALKRLARAANDFVVYRKLPDGTDGTSILAGYPWFADWGRDTMISLPGLLLSTGRFQQARQVLTVFGHYVSEGMIPNRFDDYSNEPHYNTVDASLWFIHAAYEYLRLSHDAHTFEELLLPACRAVVKGYRDGTRFGIKMEADGLITQGNASTQLTWMDAKCDGIAFTPRQGKAVEINALWYNALRLMGEDELAARSADSFRRAFWVSPFRGLADVVHEGRRDTSVRPNQIFAVSLPHSPLDETQQAAVVELVRRELLTPVGLLTLARSDPNFHGRFTGPPAQRDEAYHNGTIWPWLLGAFLEAYLKVNRRSRDSVIQAKQWLAPLIEGMDHVACMGQISEVYEATEPYRAAGCPAQAWSVAEALRLAVQLGM